MWILLKSRLWSDRAFASTRENKCILLNLDFKNLSAFIGLHGEAVSLVVESANETKQ